ncbi:MAG: Rrf2 family transcriptional regulator [Pseudomonadota bacterium]
MRLTIRSNQALRVLMVCAVNPGVLLRSADIAQTCKASEHHMAQIIHRLARLGYITSVRGRSGGVKLAKDPSEVIIGHVIRSIESEFPFVECFDPKGCDCPIAGVCTLRGHFEEALDAFYGVLDRVTLAQITENNNRLAERLFMEDVA